MLDNEENVCSINNLAYDPTTLTQRPFLIFALAPLSAQGWEAVQAEKFDGSGFSATLEGVPGFHAVGFVLGGYGSTGLPGDLCALLQPYASGSLIALKTDLEPGFEYRLQLYTKAFGQGQKLRFSFHTAPSSGGAAAGLDIALASIGTDDPSLPGAEVASAAFRVDAAGTYWGIAQALGDSPSGWARYDDMVLERRPVAGCPSVAGPDRAGCEGEKVQLGTGCLPAPHPEEGVTYCYRWEPASGLDDPSAAMPEATLTQDITYFVYVTTSEGAFVGQDDVSLTVNYPSLDVAASSLMICAGEQSTISVNGGAGLSFKWFHNGLLIDGATGSTITVTEGGVYQVEGTAANGCISRGEIAIGETGNISSLENAFEEEGFVCINVTIDDGTSAVQNRVSCDNYVEDKTGGLGFSFEGSANIITNLACLLDAFLGQANVCVRR